ncbi:MAG: hypothetical protein A2167_07955 [Planctomycetes bacterium RBG_13_46_10]|nr:MAG: hypothetical protein A2167_07955 [Planctomycetes bacterium RBG_13_46_10]
MVVECGREVILKIQKGVTIMPEVMICPFLSIPTPGVKELMAENCAKNKCALWVEAASRDKTQGGCSFRVIATMLSAIDNRLIVVAGKIK